MSNGKVFGYIWAPDEEIRDYGCVSLGPKHMLADIDEIVRMLEACE